MPDKLARPPRPAPSPTEPRPGFIAVGWIRAPRGLRGELSVDPLTDFPDRFAPGAALWAGGVRYTVHRARAYRATLRLTLTGIETKELAEPLRGLLLEVPEEELPALEDGQYYRFQLLGMEVLDAHGASLGHLEEVLDTPANDVYLVRNSEGELLIPAIDSVVKEVDVPGRRMVVELPGGLDRHPLRR